MIPNELLELAPRDLANYRPLRFDGAALEVPLTRYAPEDRELLVRIYRTAQNLPAVWQRMAGQPDYPAMEELFREIGKSTLLADAQRFGEPTRAAGLEDADIRKAGHDIRGGGLTVLLGAVELLAAIPGDEGLIRKCVEAARDHAKIMRNLTPDIDPAVRAADEAVKPHGIAHFADKLQGMTVRRGEGSVTVDVRCLYAGDISARCLETSSIDRIVYNYVNNAIRFTADGRVTVWIFSAAPDLTRWVVQNRVTADSKAFLAAAAPDLKRLFAGGITSGGHGIGLANCAEIVADCFGLESPAEAVDGGYLGAAVVGLDYLSWFHWPGMAEQGGE